MKRLLVFLLCASSQLNAEIAVIGHPDCGLTSLTQQEVKNIFMGRTQYLPNGNFALPIEQQTLRADFYYALTERPIEQINAYWARLIFRGQASPPIKLPNTQAIINVIKQNKSAIGYIDAKEVNEEVMKILLRLKSTNQ